MTPGYWVKRIDQVPLVPEEEPGDPIWHPLQHHFGITAFGVNVYTAREAGDGLVGDHDEAASGQEELYFVTAGTARFTLAGEEHRVPTGTVVAVTDPAVKRKAVAEEPGTTVLAVGAPRRDRFPSSWRADHFDSVPRAHD